MSQLNTLILDPVDNVARIATSPDNDEKEEVSSRSQDIVHSPFDDLSKWKAARIFWRATMLCFFAGVCVLMEGYQGTVTGSIVSNAGFIDQFGTVLPSGQKSLDAVYVSAWRGTSGAFQLFGQQVATLVSDRYGRTTSFYIATFLIIAGVLLESFVGTMGGWLGALNVAGFASGTNLKRTLASFFGVVILQWSGASVVFSYATYFLQQAGIKQPFQATCIVYSLLVFMVIVSFYTTERFGRRALLLTGGIGCFVCNIVIGTLGTQAKTDTVLNATLGVICIWVLFYAGCLAGVGWGLTSEIATPRLRARTAGVVINGSQCFSIIFGYVVPLMLGSTGAGARNWGVKTLYLFAGTGAIGITTNYFFLPEVRGRSFAELDEMFEARVPPRKMKSYKTEAQKAIRPSV